MTKIAFSDSRIMWPFASYTRLPCASSFGRQDSNTITLPNGNGWPCFTCAATSFRQM